VTLAGAGTPDGPEDAQGPIRTKISPAPEPMVAGAVAGERPEEVAGAVLMNAQALAARRRARASARMASPSESLRRSFTYARWVL
jgi:hypothetical protein